MLNSAEFPEPDNNQFNYADFAGAKAKNWYLVDGEEEITTGIKQTNKNQCHVQISADQSTLNVKGAQANTIIAIYAMNGMKEISSTTDQQGCANLCIASLHKGVYITKVGTYKQVFVLK